MTEERQLHIATILATFFGAGRVKPAPGTVGSVVALPFAWVIAAFGNRFLLMLAGVVIW